MFYAGINHLKKCVGKLSGREKAASVVRGKRSLRAAAGNIFIEAAVILPVVVVGLLGTVEVLNAYVQRGSVMNVAHLTAMAIQQKPDITAQELYEYQKSLGGGVTTFKEVNNSDKTAYTGETKCSVQHCSVEGLEIRVGRSAAPVKESEVRNVAPSDWSSPHIGKKAGGNRWGSSGGEDNPAWPNSASPYVADPNQDTSDDAKPYYVGVRVAWKNRSVFGMPWFKDVTMTQFASVLVKPQTPVQGTLNGQCGHTWGGMQQVGSKVLAPATFDSTERTCPVSPGLSDQGLTCKKGCSCPRGYSSVLTGTCEDGGCWSLNGYRTGGMFFYSCVYLGVPCGDKDHGDVWSGSCGAGQTGTVSLQCKDGTTVETGRQCYNNCGAQLHGANWTESCASGFTGSISKSCNNGTTNTVDTCVAVPTPVPTATPRPAPVCSTSTEYWNDTNVYGPPNGQPYSVTSVQRGHETCASQGAGRGLTGSYAGGWNCRPKLNERGQQILGCGGPQDKCWECTANCQGTRTTCS